MSQDPQDPRSPRPDPQARPKRPAAPDAETPPPRGPEPRGSVFRPATGSTEPERVTPKKVRRPPSATEDTLPPRGPVPEREGFDRKRGEKIGEVGDGPSRKSRGPIPASGGPGRLERILFGSVSSHHLSMFCRQFASYSDAGVDLVRSLSGLETQFARTALGPVVGRLREAVRAGDSIADAMEREPQAFDKLFLSMMRVAESRGGVPETLRMMADHYEARVRMFRQARSALIYPAVVLTIALAVVMLLSIFLLPKFAELLKDIAGRGAELPVVSWMLMAFADFVAAQGWWLMPAAVIGSIFAFFRIYATKKGKAILDEIGLAVPVLGGLLRKLDIARFARTLSVLMESGVDIDSSLRLTSDVMRMVPYRRAVRTTRELVLEGAELSEGMAATRRFTPDVLAIVSSGEESGKLPLSLEKLADDYEEQVEYAVKNLGQLVQPLLMIFLGLIVLFIILAVILPYISVISSIR